MQTKLAGLILVLIIHFKVILIDGRTDSWPLDYDKATKPAELTNIWFSVVPIRLISIDEKNEIMSSSIIIKLTWVDSRLAWDSSLNLTHKKIPAKSIWLPDLFVINTAEANGFFTITDQNIAMVNSNGMVYMAINVGVLRTKCKLSFYYFPFDIQNCPVRMGSWQYDDSELRIISNRTYFTLLKVEHNQIWSLVSYKYAENASDYRLSNGSSGYDIEFSLIVKRQPMNYILNNIFPCLVLNAVTFIAYFLNFTQQSAISIFFINKK